MKILKLFFVIFILTTTISCSNLTSFSKGTDPADDNEVTPKADDINQTEDPNIVNMEECPKVNQSVLIIDLKSGWWAGDGGDFFNDILASIHERCVGNVYLEYHHITTSEKTSKLIPAGWAGSAPLANGFYKNFSEYTEIWLLSGAKGDPLDIAVTSAAYKTIEDGILSSTANVFIGAGFGSIMHANQISSTLGFGKIFSTDQQEGLILTPLKNSITSASTLAMGTELKSHPLFAQVQNITDEISIGHPLFQMAGLKPRSDFLTQTTNLNVIGSDKQARPVIAVGKSGSRNVVIDTGLQRFYVAWNNKADPNDQTLRYLQNIIIYLAKK